MLYSCYIEGTIIPSGNNNSKKMIIVYKYELNKGEKF